LQNRRFVAVNRHANRCRTDSERDVEVRRLRDFEPNVFTHRVGETGFLNRDVVCSGRQESYRVISAVVRCYSFRLPGFVRGRRYGCARNDRAVRVFDFAGQRGGDGLRETAGLRQAENRRCQNQRM